MRSPVFGYGIAFLFKGKDSKEFQKEKKALVCRSSLAERSV